MLVLLLGLPASHGSLRQLKLVNEWKSVDFIFPTEHQKNDAILRQEYIPGMAVPIDVDVFYKGSIFFQSRQARFSITSQFSRGRSGVKNFRHNASLQERNSNYTWHSVTAQGEGRVIHD